jgi:hypothetical protein
MYTHTDYVYYGVKKNELAESNCSWLQCGAMNDGFQKAVDFK